jgi:hypothetical protein
MPLLISILSFSTFTTLLVLGYIGQTAYSFLAVSAALVGIVLHGFGRLNEIDFKNLKLTLRELREAKEELSVKQEQLNILAIPLVQLIALSSIGEGRLLNKESIHLRRKWYKKKIQELVDAFGIGSNAAEDIRKILTKYEKIDDFFASHGGQLQATDPDYESASKQLETLRNDVNGMLKTDIEKL